ncbi:hypothetical protein EBX93_16755, partial [bacterium]|nr:hypothetical protein [bacterium]
MVIKFLLNGIGFFLAESRLYDLDIQLAARNLGIDMAEVLAILVDVLVAVDNIGDADLHGRLGKLHVEVSHLLNPKVLLR